MPLASKEDLLSRLEREGQENADANALCLLAGLSVSGNPAQKRQRLASLASGPPSRQRLGWLELVLRARAAGAAGPDDLEADSLEGDQPAQLPAGSCDLLLDLHEHCVTAQTPDAVGGH